MCEEIYCPCCLSQVDELVQCRTCLKLVCCLCFPSNTAASGSPRCIPCVLAIEGADEAE